MATHDEKIAALEAKLKQAKERKKKAEARGRSMEAKKARSIDTRKKILAGSYVLEKASKDSMAHTRLMAGLDQFLTRPDDRAIFGFDAKPIKEERDQKTSDMFAPS